MNVTTYTTAPETYDGFGTETVAPVAGHTSRGTPVRRVETPAVHAEWQRQRYYSGVIYLVATEEDWATHLRLGLANATATTVDPRSLAARYYEADDACTAARAAGVLPADIEATWPNMLGFLRRVPGQPLHHPAPNGREDDAPTAAELVAFYDALKIHRRRALVALKLASSGGAV